jgi:hypothetical protein
MRVFEVFLAEPGLINDFSYNYSVMPDGADRPNFPLFELAIKQRACVVVVHYKFMILIFV